MESEGVETQSSYTKRFQTSYQGFRILAVLLVLVLAACGGKNDNTPTPEQVAMVRLLATIGPTATLSPADLQATMAAQPPTRTPAPIIPTATETPYIGVFLGEAEIDPLEQSIDFGQADLLALPTQPGAPEQIPLLCAFQIDDSFSTSWQDVPNLRQEMSCPIQEVSYFEGMVQFFETGVMYRNLVTNEVWAIAPGRFGEPGEFWSTGQLQEVSPAVTAPEGFRVPQGSFGAIWATIPQVRESLGFALTEEQTNLIKTQRFVGGTLLFDEVAGQTFALAVDGDAFGPFE